MRACLYLVKRQIGPLAAYAPPSVSEVRRRHRRRRGSGFCSQAVEAEAHRRCLTHLRAKSRGCRCRSSAEGWQCSSRALRRSQSRAPCRDASAFVRAVAQADAPTEQRKILMARDSSGPAGAFRRRQSRPLRHRPAGAAPHPASRRLMIAPLSGRGVGIISEVREAGIMSGITHPLSSSRRDGIQEQR